MNAPDAGTVDPVTLEVVRNKLEGIANEMQMTLLHSAFSPIVKEGMDCSAALFTADGQTIAQATAIPIHLATMIPALGAVIEKFPVGGMKDGDVYILNDPYCGGTHLPDVTVITPVFLNDGDEPAFYVGSRGHHADIGGISPGSMPPFSRRIEAGCRAAVTESIEVPQSRRAATRRQGCGRPVMAESASCEASRGCYLTRRVWT